MKVIKYAKLLFLVFVVFISPISNGVVHKDLVSGQIILKRQRLFKFIWTILTHL